MISFAADCMCRRMKDHRMIDTITSPVKRNRVWVSSGVVNGACSQDLIDETMFVILTSSVHPPLVQPHPGIPERITYRTASPLA